MEDFSEDAPCTDKRCPECGSWVEVEDGRFGAHGVTDWDVGCEIPCPLSGAEVLDDGDMEETARSIGAALTAEELTDA